MAIGQAPYNFTNTMSIQRNSTPITGSSLNNIIHEEAGSLDGLFRLTMQDQFLYGNSTVRTFINSNGEPEIERVDPRNMITGRGLEDQIASAGNIGYASTITEADIRSFMSTMTTTTTTTNPEYVMYTGSSDMTNFQQSMQTYANTGWITTNHSEPQYTKEEYDMYKNPIYPMVSTKDYKTFEIRIQKRDCDIVYTTNKGDQRQYNLLLKNAKRGVYMKMNKQEWKHEFK